MDDTVTTSNQQTSHSNATGKSSNAKTAVRSASKSSTPNPRKSAASPGATTSKAESVTIKPRAKKTIAEKKVARQGLSAKQSIVQSITPEQRYEMIERTAYLIAEKRGFVDGNPTDDWIQAETEIDNYIMSIK